MPGIFISYSRETRSAAKTLADDIEKLGYAAWLDQDLHGGKAWWDQILAQIRGCEIFVLALSPESVTSTACGRESSYAENLGKPILPIMVADGVGVLPARLSKIHYIDYRKRDIDAHADLARALRETPPAAALPQPLPEPPAIPLSYLESIAEQIDTDAPLGGRDQSDIVSQLRSGLGDPETAAGARELLVRLSKRPDLLARTGKEIDALLQSSLPRGGALPPPPDNVPQDMDTESFRAAPVATQSRWKGRGLPALVGAIVGGALGFVFLLDALRPGTEDELLFALLPAAGGAVAGAISGRSARVIACAVAGAILSAIVYELLNPTPTRNWWAVLVVLVMPLPTIAGAVLGAIIKKARKWP